MVFQTSLIIINAYFYILILGLTISLDFENILESLLEFLKQNNKSVFDIFNLALFMKIAKSILKFLINKFRRYFKTQINYELDFYELIWK